jgi:hypothetical protein
MRHRRPYVVFVAIILAGLVGLVGCSSGGTKAGGTAAGGTKAGGTAAKAGSGNQALTVGIGTAGPVNADIYWSLENGVFDKLGLHVTIVQQGGTQLTNQASGRMVIGFYGTTGMFPAVAAGRNMVVAAGAANGNSGAGIYIAKGAPYKTLMDLSGKSVGVVGANGQSFGAATAYSSYIAGKGGKPLKIVIEQTVPSLTAAVKSGQLAAAVAVIPATVISSGVLTQMINAGAPQAESITGAGSIAASWFGLKSALVANKSAVVKFIAGLRIGRQQITTASDAQVAKVLAKNPYFGPSAISAADLTTEINQIRPFWAAADGYVSQATWDKSLQAFSNWGIDIGATKLDVTSPKYSYGNAVDMSFWNAATPLVQSYLKSSGSSGSGS